MTACAHLGLCGELQDMGEAKRHGRDAELM